MTWSSSNIKTYRLPDVCAILHLLVVFLLLEAGNIAAGGSRSRSSSLLGQQASSSGLCDSRAHDLLEKLVHECDQNFMVHSEEKVTENKSEQLRGYHLCQQNDVRTDNLHSMYHLTDRLFRLTI